MNNDLISRETLKNFLLDSRPDDIQQSDINVDTCDIKIWLSFVLNIIDQAPTVTDRTEEVLSLQNTIAKLVEGIAENARPQGEWIIVDRLPNGELKIRCHNCKADFRRRFLPNFCEFCGADMQKGGTE